MTKLTKNEIRLLIDIIRDNLPKGSRKDYKALVHSIKILISLKIDPKEAEYADENFRNKVLLNLWFKDQEIKTISDETSDMNQFSKEIERKKEQEDNERRIDHIVKSFLKDKFKYMR